jgi:hypothetical protein
MYDENEILEAIFEGMKKWSYDNKILQEEIALERGWSTEAYPRATLAIDIGDQKFFISIEEIEA